MRVRFMLIAAALLLLLPGVIFSAGSREAAEPAPDIMADEDFDYETLVRLAQQEGKLTVTDTSSRIVPVAEAFAEKYGIEVSGTKMGNPEQITRTRREVDAGNVLTDVIGIASGPELINDLIPNNYVINWVPPNMRDVIPEDFQYPLTYRIMQRIFGYNTGAYDESPITNIWELTEPQWKNKVMLRDPATTTDHISFFATLTRDDYASQLADAYKAHYGTDLVTTEENAGWEWLKRFFANEPITFGSDGDVGDAVGAPGQTDPPVGLYNYTKHRDIERQGLELGVMFDLIPFIGYVETTHVAIVNGAPNPHAARLYVHFLMTEEGVGQWTMRDIGGYSPNPQVGTHPDDELGSFDAWAPFLVNPDGKLYWTLQEQILDMWMLSRQ